MGSSGRRLLAAFVGLSCALLLGTLAAADERLTIGFLDLELGSGAPEGVDRVARELHYQLAATGRFEVIDRGARDSLLQEQAFSLSDCADDDCSLEVGRLLSTKLMINGQLCRDGAVYVATIFAIDVERGTT